jgi:hypothetical protein
MRAAAVHASDEAVEAFFEGARALRRGADAKGDANGGAHATDTGDG